MKKVVGVILSLLMLTSCSQPLTEIEQGMALRGRLQSGQSCSFDAEITADYGDAVYVFSMTCQGSRSGDVNFTVTQPESIGGITGEIQGERGKLTFDGLALQFELMADDQLTPVSAPWIVLKTLLSGYITSGCTEDEGVRLTMDDRYGEEALTLDLWLDESQMPKRAEILYDGRRILTVALQNFVIV